MDLLLLYCFSGLLCLPADRGGEGKGRTVEEKLRSGGDLGCRANYRRFCSKLPLDLLAEGRSLLSSISPALVAKRHRSPRDSPVAMVKGSLHRKQKISYEINRRNPTI